MTAERGCFPAGEGVSLPVVVLESPAGLLGGRVGEVFERAAGLPPDLPRLRTVTGGGVRVTEVDECLGGADVLTSISVQFQGVPGGPNSSSRPVRPRLMSPTSAHLDVRNRVGIAAWVWGNGIEE